MTKFNETYYKKLMDGLEVQEILYSELEFSGRIDAEYYRKAYLAYEDTIHKCKNDRLFHLADFLIGPFGSAYDTDNYTDVPDFRYVRGQDVKPFVLKNTEPRYMTEEDFRRLSKYALKAGDILVSVVGTLGNACIVREKDVPAIFSCKSTVVRTNMINPYYLTCYLNSKYGRSLLLRKERGAIQKGLNLDDLKMLDIPLFSDKFQNICAKLLNKTYKLIDEAGNIYKEAEELLLETLGLRNFNPQIEQYSIKSFKKSFADTGRLDAEFYQKKYDLIESALRNYDTDIKRLDEIAEYIFTGQYAEEYFDYKEGRKYYIRGTDVCKGVVEINNKYCINPQHYSKFVKVGDLVTGRVGTIGNFGLIDRNLDGAVCSDNILCFHLPENYIPEVYALYFNLTFTNELITRLIRGSVQPRLNQETLRDILVPFIGIEVQEQLREIINKSREMGRDSKKILDKAILMVETAIEEGEEIALKLCE